MQLQSRRTGRPASGITGAREKTNRFSTAKTKEAAEQAGREAAIAEKVEQTIKTQDGQIGERNSYGNDPRNIPG